MSDEAGYLTQIAKALEDAAQALSSLEESDVISEECLAILKNIVQAEKKLRDETEIAARFNVIHTQLTQLLTQADAIYSMQLATGAVDVKQDDTLSEDECLVYAYLYNSHGRVLTSWEKFLTPQALKEHSINRPIYGTQEEIERLIRNKNASDNHGYLCVKIKRDQIDQAGHQSQDEHGANLLRLREGAFELKNIRAFVSNGKHYAVSGVGRLALLQS